MEERIEYLVGRCEAIADLAVRAEVVELLRLVLALHGTGLARLLAVAAGAPSIEAAQAAWGRDEGLRLLLELHGLELPPSAPARGVGDFVPLAALAGPARG